MQRTVLPAEYLYQSARAIVLPYSDRETAIFPEDFVASIYFRLKEESTLDIIFPGMGIKTLNQFICYFGTPNRLGRLICCLRDPLRPPKPVGFGWLCEYDGGRASFGFGYFKEVWGDKVHIDFSMMMLHYWFTEMNCEVLYGTTINPLAFRYSKRFGFKYLCKLPKFFPRDGQLGDAHLIVLEKQVFLPYYRDWLVHRG